jgi:GDP/UDP-N,N'-diacetylbacillosamine 2-epimerase (hydrolysing)
VSTDVEAAGRHMKTTLAALAPLGLKLFISYPNSDAGSHLIIRAIQEFAASHPGTCVHRNLPREVFVNLLRTADVLVGNSSCGIIEAPLLKLPVVNVGPRQVGREHADNVIFVEHDEARVRAAVQKALHDGAFKTQVRNCVNPYGDGHAGERIAEVLAETPLDARLIEKRHTY